MNILMSSDSTTYQGLELVVYTTLTYNKNVNLIQSLDSSRIHFFDENNKEYWLFERSQELQDSLDFFFCMRKKLKK